ncbi:hypothetical protein BG003_010921 [Podila horticola]|nr:hypothetical protein BG003_010921 [Podila horticola]
MQDNNNCGFYEVDRVVGHARLDKKIFYFVIWADTDYKESLDLIPDRDCRCPILVEEYWQRIVTHGGTRHDKDGWDPVIAKKETHTFRWAKKKARAKASQAA